MSNSVLTERELDKVYEMYGQYGPEKLGDFIRTLWQEAYGLGLSDGQAAAYVRGYNEGRASK